jgi:hypothetical protein
MALPVSWVAFMVSAVLLVVAVMFVAVSLERLTEAWQELLDTLRRAAGDAP